MAFRRPASTRLGTGQAAKPGGHMRLQVLARDQTLDPCPACSDSAFILPSADSSSSRVLSSLDLLLSMPAAPAPKVTRASAPHIRDWLYNLNNAGISPVYEGWFVPRGENTKTRMSIMSRRLANVRRLARVPGIVSWKQQLGSSGPGTGSPALSLPFSSALSRA